MKETTPRLTYHSRSCYPQLEMKHATDRPVSHIQHIVSECARKPRTEDAKKGEPTPVQKQNSRTEPPWSRVTHTHA
eukprot:7682365-Pyramimonas_sp.AAC.1